jgi:hypothetical protein
VDLGFRIAEIYPLKSTFINPKNGFVMNKKAICYLTNSMKPQERVLFEAQLKTDATLAADFEAQKKVFQKMEKIRLSNKIQKLVAQDRLHRARQRKQILFGIGAGVLILSIAAWQYVENQSYTNVKSSAPVVQEAVSTNRPAPKSTVPESQKPSTPQKPLPASNPTKPLKQGLQSPKPIPSQDIPYAQAVPVTMPSSKVHDPSPVVGGHLDTNHNEPLMQTLPASVRIEQFVFQERLAKMYKEWLMIEKEKYIYRYNKWCGTADCADLSPKVLQMLTEYYQGKSPDPVLQESSFNADLSWLVKTMYNIEIREIGSAKYCLAKINNDSYFSNEKQFCEILLQNPEDRNKESLDAFIKDTSSLFHEKAKELLKK